MLCTTIIGYLLFAHPQKITVIHKWAKSSNRWMDRGAAVSFIVCAKKGQQITESFAMADRVLLDSDDMVQKDCGWLLKENCKYYTDLVYEYVIKPVVHYE